MTTCLNDTILCRLAGRCAPCEAERSARMEEEHRRAMLAAKTESNAYEWAIRMVLQRELQREQPDFALCKFLQAVLRAKNADPAMLALLEASP